MLFPFVLGQAADPPMPWIIFAVAAQDIMHLVNEIPGELEIASIADCPVEAEKVANRKRIGPQIAARGHLSLDAGGVCEFVHQALCEIVSHNTSRIATTFAAPLATMD